VTFAPGAAGASSATLTFADNTVAKSHAVALGGNGVLLPPAPTASPDGGTYTSAQAVTLSDSEPGTVLHFTTDGSTPTDASPVANGSIGVNQSETLKAIAIRASGLASSVASFVYVIAPAPLAPSVAPPAIQAPAPASTVSASKVTGSAKHAKKHKRAKKHAKKHTKKRAHAKRHGKR
jgi:hypothetical protein